MQILNIIPFILPSNMMQTNGTAYVDDQAPGKILFLYHELSVPAP